MTEQSPVPGSPQIRIVDWDGPPEAVTCPLFTCAICGLPVYSVPAPGHPLSGYVIWWVHYNGKVLQQLGPFIVHRPRCMRQLERRIAGLNDPRWEGDGYSEELREFAEHLAHNTSHPFPIDDPLHRMVIPGRCSE
jgi:hypothetical protein